MITIGQHLILIDVIVDLIEVCSNSSEIFFALANITHHNSKIELNKKILKKIIDKLVDNDLLKKGKDNNIIDNSSYHKTLLDLIYQLSSKYIYDNDNNKKINHINCLYRLFDDSILKLFYMKMTKEIQKKLITILSKDDFKILFHIENIFNNFKAFEDLFLIDKRYILNYETRKFTKNDTLYKYHILGFDLDSVLFKKSEIINEERLSLAHTLMLMEYAECRPISNIIKDTDKLKKAIKEALSLELKCLLKNLNKRLRKYKKTKNKLLIENISEPQINYFVKEGEKLIPDNIYLKQIKNIINKHYFGL